MGRLSPGPNLSDELERLWWADGRLPVPRVLAVDGDGALVEDVTAPDAGDSAHEGSVPALMQALGAGVRRLHELPADECPFDASASVEVPEAWGRVLTGDTEGETFADVLALLPMTEERVVTHGDLRLRHIFVEPASTSVTAFTAVGRLGVGDRHRDLAVLDASIRQRWGDDAAAAFFAAYGFDPDPERLDFHLLLYQLRGPAA